MIEGISLWNEPAEQHTPMSSLRNFPGKNDAELESEGLPKTHTNMNRGTKPESASVEPCSRAGRNNAWLQQEASFPTTVMQALG